MPDALYKYMGYQTASIVLENRTLRWSTPATLNDPYDIQFDLRIDFNQKKVLEDTLNKLWKVYSGELKSHPENQITPIISLMREHLKELPKKTFLSNLEEAILQSFKILDNNIQQTYKETRLQLSTTKILCLADSPTNQLMWAYYADSNKGVALRFQDELGADSPYSTAVQMSYLQHIPMLFEESELSDFLSGLIVFDQKKRIQSLIYTKSDAWKHEGEWRIFAGDGRNKEAPFEDIKFGAKELTGVILGCRMPPYQRATISETVKRLYPHAELLHANPVNHSFQLELTPYYDR